VRTLLRELLVDGNGLVVLLPELVKLRQVLVRLHGAGLLLQPLLELRDQLVALSGRDVIAVQRTQQALAAAAAAVDVAGAGVIHLRGTSVDGPFPRLVGHGDGLVVVVVLGVKLRQRGERVAVAADTGEMFLQQLLRELLFTGGDELLDEPQRHRRRNPLLVHVADDPGDVVVFLLLDEDGRPGLGDLAALGGEPFIRLREELHHAVVVLLLLGEIDGDVEPLHVLHAGLAQGFQQRGGLVEILVRIHIPGAEQLGRVPGAVAFADTGRRLVAAGDLLQLCDAIGGRSIVLLRGLEHLERLAFLVIDVAEDLLRQVAHRAASVIDVL
jgi:hypothetical protein